MDCWCARWSWSSRRPRPLHHDWCPLSEKWRLALRDCWRSCERCWEWSGHLGRSDKRSLPVARRCLFGRRWGLWTWSSYMYKDNNEIIEIDSVWKKHLVTSRVSIQNLGFGFWKYDAWEKWVYGKLSWIRFFSLFFCQIFGLFDDFPKWRMPKFLSNYFETCLKNPFFGSFLAGPIHH